MFAAVPQLPLSADCSSDTLLTPDEFDSASDPMSLSVSTSALSPSLCLSAPFSPYLPALTASVSFPLFSFGSTSAIAAGHSDKCVGDPSAQTAPPATADARPMYPPPPATAVAPASAATATAPTTAALAAAPAVLVSDSVTIGSGVTASPGSASCGSGGPSVSCPRVGARLVSCSFCHATKQRCSAEVPCRRCVRLHRGHLCVKWRGATEAAASQPAAHSPAATAVDDSSAAAADGTPDDGSSNNSVASRNKRPRHDFLSESIDHPPASPLHSAAGESGGSLDVFALLIREYPCSRDFLCAPHPTASPRSFLSRATVRGLLRALAGGGLEMQPVAQLYLRTRVHAMMSDEDTETLTHNHNLRYHVLQLQRRERDRHRQDTPLHEADQFCETASAFDECDERSVVSGGGEDNRMMVWSKHTFVPAGSYRRDPATGACDGSVCGGLCKAARTHISRVPWVLTFAQSPCEPMEDQQFNNHPLLLMRRCPADNDNHAQFLERLQANLTGATCVPLAGPLELPWSASVNRAFERLFGYSQRQLRAMFVEHEWLAAFLLFDRDEWERLVVRDLVAEFGGASHRSSAYSGDRGWEAQVSCVDRWGRRFDCLLVKSFEMDDRQLCTAIHVNFIAKRSRDTTQHT